MPPGSGPPAPAPRSPGLLGLELTLEPTQKPPRAGKGVRAPPPVPPRRPRGQIPPDARPAPGERPDRVSVGAGSTQVDGAANRGPGRERDGGRRGDARLCPASLGTRVPSLLSQGSPRRLGPGEELQKLRRSEGPPRGPGGAHWPAEQTGQRRSSRGASAGRCLYWCLSPGGGGGGPEEGEEETTNNKNKSVNKHTSGISTSRFLQPPASPDHATFCIFKTLHRPPADGDFSSPDPRSRIPS